MLFQLLYLQSPRNSHMCMNMGMKSILTSSYGSCLVWPWWWPPLLLSLVAGSILADFKWLFGFITVIGVNITSFIKEANTTYGYIQWHSDMIFQDKMYMYMRHRCTCIHLSVLFTKVHSYTSWYLGATEKDSRSQTGETNGFSEARPSESSKNSKRVARSSDVEVPDAESSEDGDRWIPCIFFKKGWTSWRHKENSAKFNLNETMEDFFNGFLNWSLVSVSSWSQSA